MARSLPQLRKRERNVILSKDGTVWCNYLLPGINVNQNSSDIEQYQNAHTRLFAALSSLPTSDFLILGFKSRTHPDDLMDRCVKAIPDWEANRRQPGWAEREYPVLRRLLAGFKAKLDSREVEDFRRRFWLSIGMPMSRSMVEKALSSAADTDPHAELNVRSLRAFERRCFDVVEPFGAQRTTPAHFDWLYDRARLRGMDVPLWRDADLSTPGPMKHSEKAYPPVDFDFACDNSLLYEDFVSDVVSGESLTMRTANRLFRGRYRSTQASTCASVTSTDEADDDMPAGLTTYQSTFAVSRYPTTYTSELASYTYLVDRDPDLDADFALRFWFPGNMSSTKDLSSTFKSVEFEQRTNASDDELGATEYEQHKNQLRAYQNQLAMESGAVPMKVTALFVVGNANLPDLRHQVDALRGLLTEKGYSTTFTKGGQRNLWQMTMPGAPVDYLGKNLAAETTAQLFGAFMPLRTSYAGDDYGIPWVLNRENALSQVVFHDVLGATDKGNASIELTGEPGSGKTNLIKYLCMFMSALNRLVYLIDQTPHGEYEVFAHSMPGAKPLVVDVTGDGEKHSLDVLKVLPPDVAARVFPDIWMPALGLEPKSAEGTLLARVLNPRYRAMFADTNAPVGSTRQLLRHLQSEGAGLPGAERLVERLEFWSRQPYSAAFIDPERSKQVIDIPPLDTDSRFVIFRTGAISTYLSDSDSASKEFLVMALRAIAMYTTEKFRQVRGAGMFVLDEAHMLEGHDVLTPLIKAQDRMARKEGKFVVVGTQLAKDQGPAYDLILKRMALRQRVEENAVTSLSRVGVPPTELRVDRMMHDTAPPDPLDNNRPTSGREGEGWYNDGNGNIIRSQTFDQLLDVLRKYADTTSSKMIRAEDLQTSVV